MAITTCCITTQQEKPKDNLSDLVAGYPKLAGRMELVPETAIFRRFGGLNARNLLYLQNQLSYLDVRLKRQELEDSKSDIGHKKLYPVDYIFVNTANQGADANGNLRDGDTKQRDLMLEMQEVLEKYNHALIQQHTILQMKQPDPLDLRELQNFLSTVPMGDRDKPFYGYDREVWGSVLHRKAYSRDLVCMRGRADNDAFSRWIGWRLGKWIVRSPAVRCLKPDPAFGQVVFYDSSISKVTYWLTSAIASALPVISIEVLDQIHTKEARIWTIAAFNIVIGLCLTIFTEARRAEIFSVTAAFAAVQVVFVGKADMGSTK